MLDIFELRLEIITWFPSMCLIVLGHIVPFHWMGPTGPIQSLSRHARLWLCLFAQLGPVFSSSRPCIDPLVIWSVPGLSLVLPHGAVQGAGQGLFPPRPFLCLHQPPGDNLTSPLSPINPFWSGDPGIQDVFYFLVECLHHVLRMILFEAAQNMRIADCT